MKNTKKLNLYEQRKTSVEIKGRLKELKAYINAIYNLSSKPEKKFVILCHSRTGSSLLGDLLNCHPEIQCQGELFRILIHSKTQKILFPKHYIIGNYTSNCPVFGFDLKLYQLNRSLMRHSYSNKRFIRDLVSDGYQIISLNRKNILRQAISHIVARNRNQYNFTDKYDERLYKKISIDTKLLETKINWINKFTQAKFEILKDLNHINLIYEDDLLNSASHQTTCDKIFNYLGIDSCHVNTAFTRTSPKDLSEIIENYEELKNYIKDTEYEDLLNA